MKDTELETGLARLQQRIDALLRQAHDNEAIQRRCHEVELALIATNGLGDYLHQLLVQMPDAFNLDAVSLHLHDPEHVIRRLVEAAPAAVRDALRLHEDIASLPGPDCRTPSPWLSPFDADRHHALFDRQDVPLGSIAMLPLQRGERVLGMLNLGSRDEARFNPERATDILQHLGSISAVCLENAVNHERLRHLGLTDALTGIRNRRYFEQRVLDECRAVQRHGRPLACLFLDLDHFKQVNDRFGHHNGDQVLRYAASRISQQLRESDLLCRYGGEEFVVLLLDTERDAAIEVAERIRTAVSAKEMVLGDETGFLLTLSIGVAVTHGRGESEAARLVTRLIEGADAALYQAKGMGRNRVCATDDE